MIVEVVTVVTTVVLIGKVADVAPASTVTFACVVALVLLDDRLTPTPPAAAGPVRVTVPVALAPPTRVVGDRLKLARAGGMMVRVAA